MFQKIKQTILNLARSPKAISEINAKTDEIYWSIVFNSAIADSTWFKTKSLNPGRWAAGYPLLYILYRVYNDIKPTSILEFGLGETSKLGYQYHHAFPQSSFTIIEQDEEWLRFFSNTVHNVNPNTVLLPIEQKKVGQFETKVYRGLTEKLLGKKFDLIIVDGPWGSQHYSRYQIIDVVENDLLAKDFVILFDDYDRPGEKETVSKLREVLKARNISFKEGLYWGMKGSILICSEKYKFLTSL